MAEPAEQLGLDIEPVIEHCLKGATHGGVVSTQDALARLRGLMPNLTIADAELINLIAKHAIAKRLGVFFDKNS